ncbi:MAG TPA: hypothetical protein DEB06_09450, partial [Phycisphaerales bacterium]|nr:hypothetical protein [Phycisphaerales bacterium]
MSATGARGDLFDAVRRVCTFASSFGRVFASLDPSFRPAVVTLDAPTTAARGKAARGGGVGGAAGAALTAVECRGPQGSVVFVFGPEEDPGATLSTSVVLDDGSTLPVALGSMPVAWVLLNAHLGGRATLDYCSLNALWAGDSLFVCFGPAGAPGIISINDSAFEVTVPTGDEPLVREHEGITVVVCSEGSIDRVYPGEGVVFVGASGLDAHGAPVPHPDAPRLARIAHGRKPETVKGEPRRSPKKTPQLGGWAVATLDGFVTGEGKGFKKREGPTPVEALDTSFAYAWCRARFKGTSAKAIKALAPFLGGRAHLFLDGEPVALLGAGPGATDGAFSLPLRKQEHTLIVLAERFGGRAHPHGVTRPSGLSGHLYETAPLRLTGPKIEATEPLSPLSFKTPIFGLEVGDLTDPRRLSWSFEHRRKTPLFFALDALDDTGLLLLNAEPVGVVTRHSALRLALPEETLRRGKNSLQLALVGDIDRAAKGAKAALSLWEGVSAITEPADWAAAPFGVPAPTAFIEPVKGALNAKASGRPAWWRARGDG